MYGLSESTSPRSLGSSGDSSLYPPSLSPSIAAWSLDQYRSLLDADEPRRPELISPLSKQELLGSPPRGAEQAEVVVGEAATTRFVPAFYYSGAQKQRKKENRESFWWPLVPKTGAGSPSFRSPTSQNRTHADGRLRALLKEGTLGARVPEKTFGHKCSMAHLSVTCWWQPWSWPAGSRWW
jgi:hypothetical protein